MRRGSIALKLVVNPVIESDRESVRLAEQDLKTLHISKHMCNVKTVVSKLQDLLATLEANDIDLDKLTSDVLVSLCDYSLCEDYRLHLKIHEIKYYCEISMLLTS